MQFERWFDLNLDTGRAVKADLGTLYEGDSDSLKLGVRLRDSQGPVSVTGDASGWAMLASGETLEPFTGGKEDNTAWIVVPQGALYPGRVQIFMRISDNSEFAVTLDAVATVKRTQTGTVVNPGTPIPNVSQLEEAAANCIAATEAARAVVDTVAVASVAETKEFLNIT